MYYCKDCGCEFEKAEILAQTHGLSRPPYEKHAACPCCGSGNFHEKAARHCRCCGARLPEGAHDYCNAECKARGKKLWEKERYRRHLSRIDPISVIIREADEYNKTHGTEYSYGQYVAFIRPEEGRAQA